MAKKTCRQWYKHGFVLSNICKQFHHRTELINSLDISPLYQLQYDLTDLEGVRRGGEQKRAPSTWDELSM